MIKKLRKIRESYYLFKDLVFETTETLISICMYLQNDGRNTHNSASRYMSGHEKALKIISNKLRGFEDPEELMTFHDERECVFACAENNPGAIAFIHDAISISKTPAEKQVVMCCFAKMLKNEITGSQLYMLWNDCCERDTQFAIRIMQTAPVEEIRAHIAPFRGFPFKKEGYFK